MNNYEIHTHSTTVQKKKDYSGLLDFLFRKTFIQPGCIKLLESDSKDIYKVTKVYISWKHCSFKLSIHQIILKKMYHSLHDCFQH